MLILEIALGIVLAVLILAFWPYVLGLAAILVVLAVVVGLLVWFWASPGAKVVALTVIVIAVPVALFGKWLDKRDKKTADLRRARLSYLSDDDQQGTSDPSSDDQQRPS